jgi:hypothetical protein
VNLKNRLRRGLALATAVGALVAPAASAAPIEELLPSSANQDPGAQPSQVRIVERPVDSSFDWGDAGIGATGVVALVAIASGVLVATRRRQGPGHSIAG